MSSYLTIAEQIIRAERRPLTAKDLLRKAYKAKIVPKNLYGRTQHKTLQARLSEDILARREKSPFFRTAPGLFFLREFITDSTIPSKHRIPIVARRRQRELPVKSALSLDRNLVEKIAAILESEPHHALSAIAHSDSLKYLQTSRSRNAEDILLWSFVIMTRNKSVLTYRQGKYRESRNDFVGRRSIGFYVPVSEMDNDLFDCQNIGIMNSSLTALCMELDFDPRVVWGDLLPSAHIENLIVAQSAENVTDVLALVRFECPEWLEPLTRRLSLNDIRWHDLRSKINYVEDFDPWSQLVLSRIKVNNSNRNELKCRV